MAKVDACPYEAMSSEPDQAQRRQRHLNCTYTTKSTATGLEQTRSLVRGLKEWRGEAFEALAHPPCLVGLTAAYLAGRITYSKAQD